MDLAEGDRRAQVGIRPDPSRIDTEAFERLADERAKTVIAHFGDDGRARSEPRGLDRHVRCAASEVLRKRFDVCEGGIRLLRVQVDANPARGDDIKRGHGR